MFEPSPLVSHEGKLIAGPHGEWYAPVVEFETHQNLADDPEVYTLPRGEFIAREHAGGEPLKSLHECHPERVPRPVIIKRWRNKYPQFDLLMIEAEQARADLLVEEALQASDSERAAAKTRNAIDVRLKLAARLDPDKYGKAKPPETDDDGKEVHYGDTYVLTDSQLMVIALQGLEPEQLKAMERQAIDGTAEEAPTPPQEISRRGR